jgi:hypothetical protein
LGESPGPSRVGLGRGAGRRHFRAILRPRSNIGFGWKANVTNRQPTAPALSVSRV